MPFRHAITLELWTTTLELSWQGTLAVEGGLVNCGTLFNVASRPTTVMSNSPTLSECSTSGAGAWLPRSSTIQFPSGPHSLISQFLPASVIAIA